MDQISLNFVNRTLQRSLFCKFWIFYRFSPNIGLEYQLQWPTYNALNDLRSPDLKFPDGVKYVDPPLQFNPVQNQTQGTKQTAAFGAIPRKRDHITQNEIKAMESNRDFHIFLSWPNRISLHISIWNAALFVPFSELSFAFGVILFTSYVSQTPWRRGSFIFHNSFIVLQGDRSMRNKNDRILSH